MAYNRKDSFIKEGILEIHLGSRDHEKLQAFKNWQEEHIENSSVGERPGDDTDLEMTSRACQIPRFLRTAVPLYGVQCTSQHRCCGEGIHCQYTCSDM